jgi:hypothetical protein
MKILEAYTPAQIRACGQMLERSFEHGLALGDFLELTATLKAQAAHPMMQRFRLVFSVNGDSNSSNEAVLEAFNRFTLRTWLKMKKLFDERKISTADIKLMERKLRRADWATTKEGRVKP